MIRLKIVAVLILIFSNIAFCQDSCDVIIRHDGTEIESEIQEIGINEITYFRCQTTSPVYKIANDEVFMVRLKDGSSELVGSASRNSLESSESGLPRYQSLNELQIDGNCILIIREGKIEIKANIISQNDRAIKYIICDEPDMTTNYIMKSAITAVYSGDGTLLFRK